MVAASKPTSWLFQKFHILRHLVQHQGPQLVVWAVSLLTMGLITHSLTPMYKYSHSQFDQVRYPVWALARSVLYRLYSLHEASPKAISGRTSYLRVRLAFHPYPQLIPKLFNAHEFGPPHNFTCASTWPWIDHYGFGSTITNYSPYSDSLSLRLHVFHLTSLVTVTRRFILQQARRRAAIIRASTVCRHTVSGSLSLPSRGAFHLSLTVLCAIGPYWYFALEGGPPCFPQGFTCLVVLWILSRACRISITGLSPSTAVLSNTILLSHLHLMTVLNPGSVSRSGLGSSPFARRYQENLV